MSTQRFSRIFFIIFLTICVAAFALADASIARANPPVQTPQKLRVGVFLTEPFVIPTGDHYSGFSVDYWEKIAAQLGMPFNYVQIKTADEAEQALKDSSLDLIIGGIGVTAEREKIADFSSSYLITGQQILVPKTRSHPVLSVFAPLIAPAVLQVFGFALIFAIIMAHVIYFVERRSNPDFQQGYLVDIWEAFWYLLIIVATGEYGDKEARAPIKRIVTVAFWLLGVLFIAQFTAAATSTLTVTQLLPGINSLEDLAGKRVVTIPQSASADLLDLHNIPYTAVSTPDDAYSMLNGGQADAFVFQSAVLQYYAANAGQGKAEVVGPVYTRLPIAIAMPLGSPLRKPINEVIAKFNLDGTYDQLSQRWFGSQSQ